MAAWETGIKSGQVVLVWLPVHRPGCHVEVTGSKLEIFGLWARNIAERRVYTAEHLKIKKYGCSVHVAAVLQVSYFTFILS